MPLKQLLERDVQKLHAPSLMIASYNYIIPQQQQPDQSKKGYKGITLSVRPPACLCNCVRSKSFLWRNIKSFYFTKRLFMTKGCVMILTPGHFSKF